MNYIAEINGFWDSIGTNPLSTGQVSLYFALLHINNRSNWTEWFTVSNQVLSILTGLSKSGILKARNELKQRGIIDFKERGTKATAYKMLTMTDSVQESNRVSTLDGVRNSNRVSTLDGVRNSNPLININTNINNSTCAPDTDAQQKEHDFEIIYGIYPKKRGKAKAYEHYLGWLKGRTVNGKKVRLNNRQMYLAVMKYVKQCQADDTDLQYYKNFDTLMGKQILDYVEAVEE